MANLQLNPGSGDRLQCILLKMNRLLSDSVVGYGRSSVPSCVEDVTEDIEKALTWQLRENYCQIQENNDGKFTRIYGSVLEWQAMLLPDFDSLDEADVEKYVTAHFPYVGRVKYRHPEYGTSERAGVGMIVDNIHYDLAFVLPGYLMIEHIDDDYLRGYCSNMLQAYEAGFWPYGLVDPWLDYPNQKPSKVLAYRIPKRG